MELTIWGAAAVLLAWGVLELRGIRRELGCRRSGEKTRERGTAELAEPDGGERGPAGWEEEGTADPAMLEGFANLMRYTERTARERDAGT